MLILLWQLTHIKHIKHSITWYQYNPIWSSRAFERCLAHGQRPKDLAWRLCGTWKQTRWVCPKIRYPQTGNFMGKNHDKTMINPCFLGTICPDKSISSEHEGVCWSPSSCSTSLRCFITHSQTNRICASFIELAKRGYIVLYANLKLGGTTTFFKP